MTPRIKSVETVFDGWSRLSLATVETAGDAVVKRVIEDHGSAACVLPYDPDRKVATLVRLMRAPPLMSEGVESLTEAPAGMLDGDAPADCARREAEEEVGLRLDALEPLGSVWSMPGVSTERIHLFLAAYRNSDRVSEGGGVAHEHEEIEVLELGLTEVWAMIGSGAIADAKTVILVQALKLRRPDLF